MKKRILAALLALGCALLVFTCCVCKYDTTPNDYTQIIHDAREAEDNDYYMIFSPAEDGKFTAQYGYSASYPAEDLNDEIQNMLLPLLDLPEDAPGSGTAAGGALACRDLRFSYEEGREVLHGVSMDFPHGAFTAIVGESGCGKSTLLQLLTRAWDPQQGEILLNDSPIASLNEAALRQTISVVPQRVHLFSATLRDNLLLASPGSSDESLAEILRRVGLEKLLEDAGLNSWLGEGGRQLSVAALELFAPDGELGKPLPGRDLLFTQRRRLKIVGRVGIRGEAFVKQPEMLLRHKPECVQLFAHGPGHGVDLIAEFLLLFRRQGRQLADLPEITGKGVREIIGAHFGQRMRVDRRFRNRRLLSPVS